MRGLEKNCMGRGQTNKYIYKRHRDSMIESAQWADSMKMAGANQKLALAGVNEKLPMY